MCVCICGGAPRGTEAPRAHGLFCWKLVRIKSLACTPLCPAEVDKHGWSRSETSPRGKKGSTAEALRGETRVKFMLRVFWIKTHNQTEIFLFYFEIMATIKN